MGIATIVKLLDGESSENGKAFYLREFLKEYASFVAMEDDEGLPEELSRMIVAPLSTFPVLMETKTNQDSQRDIERSKNSCKRIRNPYRSIQANPKINIHKNGIYQHNCYTTRSKSLSHPRCQQSSSSIVNDVVYSLVQKREKLRCRRNHERRHSFRRRKRRKPTNNSSNSSSTPTQNEIAVDPGCGSNALIHGFGVSREGGGKTPPGMNPGISYQHPNENVTFCKSSPVMKRLHQLVGDAVFRMMLLHTRCFLPILPNHNNKNKNNNSGQRSKHSSCKTNENRKRKRDSAKSSAAVADAEDGDSCNNYILLCGPPLLFDSNRLRTALGLSTILDDSKTNKKKRPRKRKGSFPTLLAEASPLRANESLSRFSLLYSDAHVPNVGLPKSHPFSQKLERQKQNQQQNDEDNQQHQQQQGKNIPALPQHHCQMNDFQFMLNVIFELHLDNKNKQRRIRKRLGGVGRSVCERLWKNYSSCHDYGRILTKHCPLPDIYKEITASTSHTNVSNGDRYLAKLAHAYTSKEGIVSFLGSVLRRVFPSDFWGSEANFRSFMASVRSFVHLRRQEKLANKNIMHGISVTSMKWLYPAAAVRSSNTTRSSDLHSNHTRKRRKPGKQRSNHEATTELTLQAFRWVFKGFVIPLLRSCFYVTETEFAARELHYYRKPIWSLFRALSLQKVTTAAAAETTTTEQSRKNNKHFKILSNHHRALEFLRKQKMGISKLRFLPKATGMRPIAQLSRSARFDFPAIATNNTEPKTNEIESQNSKRTRINNDSPHESRPTKKQKVAGDPLSMAKQHFPSFESESLSFSSPQYSFSRLPTNVMLENVLDVLTYECGQKHRPYGNGLGNLQQFYVRYREYMARFRQLLSRNQTVAGKPPKLFFAKVDIEKCYDRIHQDYLLGLVQDMVSHNSYVVQTLKMNCANPRKEKSGQAGTANAGDRAHRFKKIVESIEDYQSFHHCEHPMAQQHQHTVFEILKCSLVNKADVQDLLREHLLQHVVVATGRHKPKLLLQTRGISQGSTLSMLLCNLYYGKVEKLMELDGKRKSSASIAQEDHNKFDLMSRFVDDFLFVSPDENSLREFLDKTHQGKPELGAKINPSKTLVNVEASVKIASKEGGAKSVALSRSDRIMNNGRKFFPWCGLLFDTATGEVMVDYERFRGGKLRRSLTIDADGREGEQLAQRLRAFLFPRCLPILYDDLINSFDTIVANFYQMMLFGACKTKEYLLGLNALMKRRPCYIHNASFLLKCIDGLSGYAIKNIRSKSRHCILDSNADKINSVDIDASQSFGVDPTIAFALSLQAFCDVFAYTSGFGSLSRLLREKFLASSKGIPHKKREELRKITARAFDNFRMNAMIEK